MPGVPDWLNPFSHFRRGGEAMKMIPSGQKDEVCRLLRAEIAELNSFKRDNPSIEILEDDHMKGIHLLVRRIHIDNLGHYVGLFYNVLEKNGYQILRMQSDFEKINDSRGNVMHFLDIQLKKDTGDEPQSTLGTLP